MKMKPNFEIRFTYPCYSSKLGLDVMGTLNQLSSILRDLGPILSTVRQNRGQIERIIKLVASNEKQIQDIVNIYANYPGLATELIVASVRSPNHVLESALMGAHGVTVPFKVIEQLMKHPLTDIGISRFLEDWEKVR